MRKASLELRFSRNPELVFEATGFRDAPQGPLCEYKLGGKPQNALALGLFMIKYKIWGENSKERAADFYVQCKGDSVSPVNTLANELEAKRWIRDVFRPKPGDESTPNWAMSVIFAVDRGDNRSGASGKLRKVRISHKSLPPSEVKVFIDGTQVLAKKGFAKMHADLLAQWKELAKSIKKKPIHTAPRKASVARQGATITPPSNEIRESTPSPSKTLEEQPGLAIQEDSPDASFRKLSDAHYLFRPLGSAFQTDPRPTQKDFISSSVHQLVDLLPALQPLEQHGRILLVGLPGSGKTTLATSIAFTYRSNGWRVLYSRFRTGVPSATETERMVKVVKEEKTLLILDDIHQQTDFLSAMVEACEQRAPSFRLLVVGRGARQLSRFFQNQDAPNVDPLRLPVFVVRPDFRSLFQWVSNQLEMGMTSRSIGEDILNDWGIVYGDNAALFVLALVKNPKKFNYGDFSLSHLRVRDEAAQQYFEPLSSASRKALLAFCCFGAEGVDLPSKVFSEEELSGLDNKGLIKEVLHGHQQQHKFLAICEASVARLLLAADVFGSISPETVMLEVAGKSSFLATLAANHFEENGDKLRAQAFLAVAFKNPENYAGVFQSGLHHGLSILKRCERLGVASAETIDGELVRRHEVIVECVFSAPTDFISAFLTQTSLRYPRASKVIVTELSKKWNADKFLKKVMAAPIDEFLRFKASVVGLERDILSKALDEAFERFDLNIKRELGNRSVREVKLICEARASQKQSSHVDDLVEAVRNNVCKLLIWNRWKQSSFSSITEDLEFARKLPNKLLLTELQEIFLSNAAREELRQFYQSADLRHQLRFLEINEKFLPRDLRALLHADIAAGVAKAMLVPEKTLTDWDLMAKQLAKTMRPELFRKLESEWWSEPAIEKWMLGANLPSVWKLFKESKRESVEKSFLSITQPSRIEQTLGMWVSNGTLYKLLNTIEGDENLAQRFTDTEVERGMCRLHRPVLMQKIYQELGSIHFILKTTNRRYPKFHSKLISTIARPRVKQQIQGRLLKLRLSHQLPVLQAFLKFMPSDFEYVIAVYRSHIHRRSLVDAFLTEQVHHSRQFLHFIFDAFPEDLSELIVREIFCQKNAPRIRDLVMKTDLGDLSKLLKELQICPAKEASEMVVSILSETALYPSLKIPVDRISKPAFRRDAKGFKQTVPKLDEYLKMLRNAKIASPV